MATVGGTIPTVDTKDGTIPVVVSVAILLMWPYVAAVGGTIPAVDTVDDTIPAVAALGSTISAVATVGGTIAVGTPSRWHYS